MENKKPYSDFYDEFIITPPPPGDSPQTPPIPEGPPMTDEKITSLLAIQEKDSPQREGRSSAGEEAPYRKVSEDPRSTSLIQELEDDMAESLSFHSPQPPPWLHALSQDGALLDSYKAYLLKLREAKRDALEKDFAPEGHERIRGALESLREQLNFVENYEAQFRKR